MKRVTTNTPEFAVRILNAIIERERRLTVAGIAQCLGISKTALYYYLEGTRSPSWKRADDIVHFGTDILGEEVVKHLRAEKKVGKRFYRGTPRISVPK